LAELVRRIRYVGNLRTLCRSVFVPRRIVAKGTFAQVEVFHGVANVSPGDAPAKKLARERREDRWLRGA
jgi:hypothetical protein